MIPNQTVIGGLLLGLTTIGTASIVSKLDDTYYYSPDAVEATLGNGTAPMRKTTPITYIEVSDAANVSATIENFLSNDDVFSVSFLGTVFYNGIVDIEDFSVAVQSYNKQARTYNTATWDLQGSLRPGPYFLSPDGSVTKVYRLYNDPNFAFVESFTGPDENGSYTSVTGSIGDTGNGAATIAVPSRLYYPDPSEEKPLSGLRFGVKDIVDVKGIRTSAGSRAIFALNRIANDTGVALQNLIDLGAVLVGKVKTTQYALSEVPTGDYIDQLGPYNPRGDGYQNPQASSVGTGVSVAAYNWLDFGFGTDTGGSIRYPSMQNGIFGMRITNSSQSLDGMLSISPRFDTPGLMARSASVLQTLYGAWLPTANYSSYPKRIILPTEWWPPTNITSVANSSFNTFISNLSSFLDAKLDYVSQNASFKAYTNGSEGISSWLGNSYSNITKYDQVHLTRDPVVSEYQARFDAYPFINPLPLVEFEWGDQVTLGTYSTALSRVLKYQEWWNSEMTPTCEDSVVIYPFGIGTPSYRNIYKSPPTNYGDTYVVALQAVFAGCPDITVPFGITAYNSTISKKEEHLPLTVGIIAAPGCDTMLTDLVADLAKNGVIVGELYAGRELYEQAASS